MSREMKDSGIEWIGEIPKNWEIKPIKRNYKIYNGSTPKSDKKEYWDGNIVWITPIDMYENTYINQSNKTITEIGLNSCGTTLIPINSVILSTRAPIGQVCLNMVELCTNQGCKSLVANEKSYSKYLMYYLMIQTNILNMYGRGTTFLELSTNNLANFIMPIPSLSDQQKIANQLDTKCAEIDNLISLQEVMIAELKAYKQSVITEAVCKGLDKNVPMKDSGVEWIGEIPEHWNLTRLKLITREIGDGLHGTPIYDDNGGHYFINGNNLGNDVINLHIDTRQVNENEYKKYRIRLDFNSILISLNGTIGNLSFYNGELVILSKSSGYINLEDVENKYYIKYVLMSDVCKRYFNNSFSGTTINNLSLNTLRNTYIVYPSLSEQQAIANYLDKKCANIDQLISIKQQKAVELKEYKKSMIYEYVTGKKEVI